MNEDTDASASFDLSGAFEDLFDFERELEGFARLTAPKLADDFAGSFEAAGERIEQALVRAAKTGEVNFDALISGVLADMARIGAGAVLDQVFTGLGGLGGGMPPVSVNLTMPEGSDVSSIMAAQGQIASAIGQAVMAGGRWS